MMSWLYKKTRHRPNKRKIFQAMRKHLKNTTKTNNNRPSSRRTRNQAPQLAKQQNQTDTKLTTMTAVTIMGSKRTATGSNNSLAVARENRPQNSLPNNNSNKSTIQQQQSPTNCCRSTHQQRDKQQASQTQQPTAATTRHNN